VQRLGHEEEVDYDLQLALKLSVEESKTEPLPASDQKPRQSAQREGAGDVTCSSELQASVPSSGAGGSPAVQAHQSPTAQHRPQLAKEAPAASSVATAGKTSATPALFASAVSARDTKKKEKRFQPESSSNAPPQPALESSAPSSGVKVKSISGKAPRRRVIDDSEDEEEQATNSGPSHPAANSSNQGAFAPPNRGECKEMADEIHPFDALHKKQNSALESDTIPDSEDEDREQQVEHDDGE
jgi:hypothetical protein